jgi:hypothetical protein
VFFATIMRVVVLLLVLLVLMSITSPTLAVTTSAAAAALPVEPDGGSGGQPGEPGGRPNTTPPRSDSSSDGPFIQFQGRLPGNGTGIQNNNTRVIPARSPPPPATNTTTTPVTKTDTFITATINGSRFANNDTIAINGTVGGYATPSNTGKLYVEVKDPHNETVMYDSTNMTTLGNTKSPFSYKFVAGELDANTTTNPSRTVLKPMNESGLNYTMTVGYRMLETSPSEVDFVFAYDPDGGVGGGPTTVASQFAGNNTTTTTTTTQAPVIPPQPVLDKSDHDDDDDSSSSSSGDDDGSDSSSDNEDSDDDDDDSRDALEILKDVLNREPPRDVDEDDD